MDGEDRKIELDLMLYGQCAWKVGADGTKQRVDPQRLTLPSRTHEQDQTIQRSEIGHLTSWFTVSDLGGVSYSAPQAESVPFVTDDAHNDMADAFAYAIDAARWSEPMLPDLSVIPYKEPSPDLIRIMEWIKRAENEMAAPVELVNDLRRENTRLHDELEVRTDERDALNAEVLTLRLTGDAAEHVRKLRDLLAQAGDERQELLDSRAAAYLERDERDIIIAARDARIAELDTLLAQRPAPVPDTPKPAHDWTRVPTGDRRRMGP